MWDLWKYRIKLQKLGLEEALTKFENAVTTVHPQPPKQKLKQEKEENKKKDYESKIRHKGSKALSFSDIGLEKGITEVKEFEPAPYIFVSADGDGIGATVEQKVMANDLEGIIRQSEVIKQGQAYLKSSFEALDGRMLVHGGDDNLAVLEKEHLDKLERIRKGYQEITGFTITFGVGNNMRDAVKSLVYGKLTGKDKLVFWDDSLNDKLSEIIKPQTPKEKYEEHGLLPEDITEKEDKKELIEEHERLVDILESPSHKDDKEEAKRQGKELKALKDGKKYKPANPKDKIPGGLADDKKPGDFCPKQLRMGIKVEMEHTNDKEKAREIAMDHLTEIPDYYTRLDTMEEGAKDDGKFKDVKKKLDIVKGAMRRLAGRYDPHKEAKRYEVDTAAGWQQDNEHMDRQDLPRIEGKARMRALHHLSSKTPTRKASDGKREFLLHRGTDVKEARRAMKPGQTYSHSKHTSWSPKHHIAESFASTHQQKHEMGRGGGGGHIMSAWIHEDNIHHVPRQLGAVEEPKTRERAGMGRRGPNEFEEEHEVIVRGGHRSPRAQKHEVAHASGDAPRSLDAEIQHRGKALEGISSPAARKEIAGRKIRLRAKEREKK